MKKINNNKHKYTAHNCLMNESKIGSNGVPATNSLGNFLKKRFVCFLPLRNPPDLEKIEPIAGKIW